MKRRNLGNDAYAAREKALAKLHRTVAPQVPWLEFKKSQIAKDFYKQYKGNGQGLGAGPSRTTEESKQSGGEVAPDADELLAPYLSQQYDPVDFEFLSKFLHLPAMGEPMEATTAPTVEQPSGVVSGEHGGSGVPTKGGVVNASPIVPIPRSLGTPSTSFSFHKLRNMFAYAYANAQLSGTDRDMFCTPLSFVPVDFLPFYISSGEYISLPNQVPIRVTDVWCKVKILGVRSAFDTGQTISGTATSEYCPILLTAVGLNNKIDICNYKYTTASQKPMIPTQCHELVSKNIIEKYYTHYNSSVQCVPRSAEYFAVQYWNKETVPDGYVKYQPHTGKMFRLDKVVQQSLLNSAIGEIVIDYKYKVKEGWITRLKQFNICGGIKEGGSMHHYTHMNQPYRVYYEPTMNNQKQFEKFSYNQQAASTTQYSLFSTFDANYSQTLEVANIYRPNNASVGTSAVQPQVHIGMCAIPQLNPANDNKNYLNACVYYNIECGINLVTDYESIWTYGYPTCHNAEAVFTPWSQKNYSQPKQIFGDVDYSSGNIVFADQVENVRETVNRLMTKEAFSSLKTRLNI